MQELVLIIIGFALGWLWGIWRTTRSMLERVAQHPELFEGLLQRLKSMKQDETEGLDPLALGVVTEWVGDRVFLYREDTHEFLAQGDTISQAVATAEQRFPELKFNIRADTTQQSAQ